MYTHLSFHLESFIIDSLLTRKFFRRRIAIGISFVFFLLQNSFSNAEVILQYFESHPATISRRLPDVFMAGYRAIWIPPMNRAEGGQSAGYDVFNRFEFSPFYGTSADLQKLIQECRKANVLIYADIVLNHNGYENLSTPGFVGPGKPDYPGFVVTLPDDIDGDFHGAFDSGDLNGRINGGLIDIAQEKNHRFIRHPVSVGNPLNIPNEPVVESNRQFYPDIDPNSPPELGNTTNDRHSPSGFNLDRPSAGDPIAENATGYLIRYCKWMVEVVGYDGFRLDAASHIPTFFWNDFYDGGVKGIGRNGATPFSFGEVTERYNFDLLRSYCRKDGFGNRDLLDFRLYYNMREIFSAHGFADMRLLEGASVDAIDGGANDGSRGVTFVSNHDQFAPPPDRDNVAYAHILTRTGYPIVYFNALEFGTDRSFPTRGRGDALGGQFGTIITQLVGIHQSYARGVHLTRSSDEDAYIYERDQSLIVGLNDNEAFDADRTIQTSFGAGTKLVELTGNPRATNQLVIGADGTTTVTIPKNSDNRGYSMWGPQAPRGSTTQTALTISPVDSVDLPDPTSVPDGIRRLTSIEHVKADSPKLTLVLEDDNLDDNALIRIDNGAINVIGTPTIGGGEFKGFQKFTDADPGFSGKAIYSATLDCTKLPNGIHYIEVLAFLKRDPGQPPIFSSFRKVISLDR